MPHIRNSSRLPAALLFALVLSPASIGEAKTPFEASHQFIEAGQLTEARRALESELRLRPEHLEARYNLAILLEETGHPDEALALYEENLGYGWHLPSIVNMATLLQQRGEREKARDWLQKAAKKIKYEAAPWYLLAAMAEQDGNIPEAKKLYEKAVKADPLNGFAYLRLATFQSRHKLSDLGLKHAHKAIHLLPGCAPCWQQYGDIMLVVGNKQEALEALQRSLAIQPESQTRQKLINLLHDLGQHQRAERMQQALNAKLKYEKLEKE